MTPIQWKFFTTTEDTWAELLAACGRAKVSIDLEEYVFGYGGEIEREFVELFLKKTKEGVKIRLLLDAVGSFSFYRSEAAKQLLGAGVKTNFHFAIFPPPLKRILPFILRDHRKLLVIDSREAYIGGVIIEERARTWRDTFVRLEGDIVNDLQHAFDKAWERTLKNESVGQVKSENEKQDFFILGNSFHLHDKHLYREFLKAIVHAKKYIYITTPYFFPSREFLRALYFARKRGVVVYLLLPKFSDNKIADILSKLYYPSLRRHGVRIFLYNKAILHAKTITLDGKWGTIGSCNLDLLSLWWNYELNVVSRNLEFVHELETHFEKDLETAEELFV